MNIKLDVHTMRVLYRLGVAGRIGEAEAIAAARRLNPAYPGELDGALWLIGRKWCVAGVPLCGGCPAEDVCQRVVD